MFFQDKVLVMMIMVSENVLRIIVVGRVSFELIKGILVLKRQQRKFEGHHFQCWLFSLCKISWERKSRQFFGEKAESLAFLSFILT